MKHSQLMCDSLTKDRESFTTHVMFISSFWKIIIRNQHKTRLGNWRQSFVIPGIVAFSMYRIVHIVNSIAV